MNPASQPNPLLVELAEETTYAYQMTYARLPGGEAGKDASISWYRTGLPGEFFNGILRTRFPAVHLDDHVRAALQTFQQKNIPMRWYIGPTSRPENLEQALIHAGLRFSWSGPALALRLADLRRPQSAPAGLEIQRVQDPQALAAWVGLFLCEGSLEARQRLEWVYTVSDYGKALDLRLYLGLIDRQPVATACMYHGSRAAAIKHVFTLPAYQRRGIASALTLRALDEAQALGRDFAALTSSSQGYEVYQRLGFVEVCRFSRYVWEPG